MLNAEDLSPDQKTELLEERFRFAGRGHPAVDAMFTLASEWGIQEPCRRPGEPVAFKALPPDPMDIIQMEVRLPPMPAILLELKEIIHAQNTSARHIGRVIGKDPGLTAWVLKLVNSPYYGFSAKVSTISRAISLVGIKQIQLLAMAGGLNSLAVLLPKGVINMNRFWRHSIATGIVAQELWKHTGRAESEQLFVCGLLHDCGKLAIAYAAPKVSQYLHRSGLSCDQPEYEAEKELMQSDHAHLGGMLMHRWNMPQPLVMSILRHHHVEDAVRYPEAAAVHIADLLTNSLGLTLDPGACLGALCPAAWDALGLPPQKLRFVVDMLLTKLDGLVSGIRP